MTKSQTPSASGAQFLRLVGPPIVLVAGLILWLKLSTPKVGGLEPGNRAPKIEAEGWLNGEAPGALDLAGNVVVVHAWFDT